VLESFAHWVQDVVRTVGYPGVLLLITLESTLVPIPSELVMPFAGYMASKGEFSLPVILVINTVGAMIGSSVSYWIGVAGGKPFLVNYGKYFLVRQHDIAKTEAFFARHGKKTILIGRFLPIIRHVISVPAGIARMPL
jgi:membrane protein DedA with SNARE-associated domain